MEADFVDPALIEFRNESLAEKFNYDYSDKAALVSSVLKKSNSVLTPRRPSSAEPPKPPAAVVAEKAPLSPAPSKEALDTPREAAAAPPPSPAPTPAPAPAPAPAPSIPEAPKPPSTPLPPPGLPPTSAPPDDEDTFQITVPEGVNPGDKLKATTPSGVKVLLRVPEGAGPGTVAGGKEAPRTLSSDRPPRAWCPPRHRPLLREQLALVRLEDEDPSHAATRHRAKLHTAQGNHHEQGRVGRHGGG